MTIPEFLEKLKATKGEWTLVGECIRSGGHCPLTSLVAECKNANFWYRAATTLGIEALAAAFIVEAADHELSPADTTGDMVELRRQLLAATVNRS